MTPPDSVWMITRDCPPRTSQGCLWSCVWTPINRPSQYPADCIWTSNSQNPQQWHLAPSQPSSIKAIFLENQLHVMINKGIGILNQLSHRERHILQGHPGLFKKNKEKRNNSGIGDGSPEMPTMIIAKGQEEKPGKSEKWNSCLTPCTNFLAKVQENTYLFCFKFLAWAPTSKMAVENIQACWVLSSPWPHQSPHWSDGKRIGPLSPLSSPGLCDNMSKGWVP